MNSEQHELLVRIDERVEGITRRMDHLPCEAGSEKYAALDARQQRLGERVKNISKIVWIMFALIIAQSMGNLISFLKD